MNPADSPSLAAFLLAAVLSVALTPLMRRLAFRAGVLDRPDRRLKRHKAPVPYLGGVAIFLGSVGAVVAMKLWLGEGPWLDRLRGAGGILAGSTCVFLVGLRDDFRPMRPRTKLLWQAAATAIPIAFGVHIRFIDRPEAAWLLTLLWLVGVTNALNLTDIKDGLCAGLSAIAAAWFWLISSQHGRLNDALMAAAICGACLGFLRLNRAPARIYMGDAGSLFLGFALGSVALGLGVSRQTNLGVVAPLLILGVPLFETFFVMAVRWMQGKPVMQGSPDHIPIRMERMGWSTRAAVAWLWAAGAGLGAAAWLVVQLTWERALLVAGAVGAAALLAAIRLASVRVDPVPPVR